LKEKEPMRNLGESEIQFKATLIQEIASKKFRVERKEKVAQMCLYFFL